MLYCHLPSVEGNCNSNYSRPKIGKVGDKFTLTCKGWINASPPTRYEYFYNVQGNFNHSDNHVNT